MQFQSGKASFQRTRCPKHLYIFSNTARKAVDEILAEGRQAKEFHPGTSWEEGFPNTTCQEGPKDKQDTSLLPLSLSEHSIACSVLEVGEFLSRQGGGKQPFILRLPSSLLTCLHTIGFFIVQLEWCFARLNISPAAQPLIRRVPGGITEFCF